MRFYAGIGSRDVSFIIRYEMEKVASFLEEKGFTLRSGNAEGSDQAFAQGVKEKAQIWLPWHDFQIAFQYKKPEHKYHVILKHDKEAFDSVKEYHPRGKFIKPSSSTGLFMARNYRQVVGLSEPNSEFIICYTKESRLLGGTAQAMRIANALKIPIINMWEYPTSDYVIQKLYETVQVES